MRFSNFAIWTFVRWEWIEHPTPCSSNTCSTTWATTAYLISGEWWESNPWPKEPQSSTLPTELQSPYFVGGVGFEPTVFLMYWVYSPAPIHHLSSPPIISSGWHDSNVRSPLQHAPVPKTGEVYQLLHIQIINFSKLVNDLKIKRASSLLRKLFISYIV